MRMGTAGDAYAKTDSPAAHHEDTMTIEDVLIVALAIFTCLDCLIDGMHLKALAKRIEKLEKGKRDGNPV